MYGFRYDERLETNVEESTRLVYTLLCAELEHLKIETRLIDEKFASVVYYESRKREVTRRLINEGRCDERLKAKVEESTCLAYTELHDKTNVVYYESIKRELKTKLIYECRCDERLTNEIEESIRLACTVLHDKTN